MDQCFGNSIKDLLPVTTQKPILTQLRTQDGIIIYFTIKTTFSLYNDTSLIKQFQPNIALMLSLPCSNSFLFYSQLKFNTANKKTLQKRRLADKKQYGCLNNISSTLKYYFIANSFATPPPLSHNVRKKQYFEWT